MLGDLGHQKTVTVTKCNLGFYFLQDCGISLTLALGGSKDGFKLSIFLEEEGFKGKANN